MSQTPQEYITSRRRELRQQVQQLNAELAELDRMESVLGDGPLFPYEQPPPDQANHGSSPQIAAETPARRRRIPGGIKKMALDALMATGPLTANQMLTALEREHGLKIDRTSLSPQLSRLKKDGLVTAHNAVWSITEAGREYARE